MPNPFVHCELNTGDVAKAKTFYKALFGWKLKDMKMGPGMTYTVIDPGGGTGGGMAQKHDPSAPTAWLTYVDVADVKKTIAKARKAGANVLVEYMAVADMGALGIFVDPTGATLGVWQSFAQTAKPAKKAARKSASKPAKKKPARKGAR
jgi:predicted enzyme related to lactoylglutathione lyase